MEVFFHRGGQMDKLKCSICEGYLTAPISQCGKDHNVCEACKRKVACCPSCRGSFVSRNHDLERLSETTRVPCINVVYGCSEELVVNKLNEHGVACPYRLYKCFASMRNKCEWRGGKNVILAHVQEKHTELKWWKGERSKILLENLILPKEDQDRQLVMAHDELFWFHQHYSAKDERIYSAVQYIGSAELAKKFVCKITYASVTSPEKVSMACLSRIETEDIRTILKPENCAYVGFRKLGLLIHDYKVMFEIRIKKVDK